jgi:Holliday junction resolvase RusA-like endonuclease
MTKRDRWKHRPVVDHYYALKDELRLQANKLGLQSLPDSIESIIFVLPMPDSWSEKKKVTHDKTPHKQTPDLDNLLKTLQDCLCNEDKHIYHIGSLDKYWGRGGKIIIQINDTTT